VKDELTTKGILVIMATENVELLPSDPHVWLDPVAMQIIVQRIRDGLIEIDPGDADTYRKNAEAYLAKLSALDKAYRDGLASCDIREVVTSHNAFNYLAKRYNLTMLSISGLSPEDEPSPKRMAEVADLAKVKKIDTIFFETFVSPKLSETIAQEVGAKTAVLNPIEGLTNEEHQAGETYISLMEQNLQNLRMALRCR
jgi:zinc transport system substrate-binding protein